MKLLHKLKSEKLIHPPEFITDNTHYLTIMGSYAYGVSLEASDMDLYGICVPPKGVVFPHTLGVIPGFGHQGQRFEQWQEHHIQYEGTEYDFQIYSIIKFFQLAMENNANILDALFAPENCVMHCTALAKHLRDNRTLFLHKGAYHKFMGYAHAQLKKIRTKEATGKRKVLIEKYGYDCYDKETTEFLTSSGWKSFDAISQDDLLAGVVPATGELVFEKPNGSIDKKYTGMLYTIDTHLTRAVVTSDHSMLVSRMHRQKSNGFSTEYCDVAGDWSLTPLSDLMTSGRYSWYHIRRSPTERVEEYPIEDDYLKLAGLYVSEGTLQFRDQKVKVARVTQTLKGKPKFYVSANALELKRYDYDKESVWDIPRVKAERLYNDFGYGSHTLFLPSWTLHLSSRQAKLFWDYLCLGDGTKASKGDVYYSCNHNLSNGIQAMMVSAGYPCVVRGPYSGVSSFTGKMVDSYQTYLPYVRDAYACVDFKGASRILRHGEISTTKSGKPIKEEYVENRSVVCFDMPCGTLVTRNNGIPSIQGNCKFAYHLLRLTDEVEQILETGDLVLGRNKGELKAIRAGEYTLEELETKFEVRKGYVEELYRTSTLRHSPPEAEIKALLLQCLEMHYGRLDNVYKEDRTGQLVNELVAVINRYQ